jgi:uncharacterized membrane protein YhaH (DUF805 family)
MVSKGVSSGLAGAGWRLPETRDTIGAGGCKAAMLLRVSMIRKPRRSAMPHLSSPQQSPSSQQTPTWSKWLLFLFSPTGRINRRAWWFHKALMALGIATLVILQTVHVLVIFAGMMPFLLIGMIWSSVVIEVKRWHDLDRSGWWMLVDLVPFLGPLYSFAMLGFVPGRLVANRFGPPPSPTQLLSS